MISKFKKANIKWAALALALVLFVGCSNLNNPIQPSSSQNQENSAAGSVQTNGNNQAEASASEPVHDDSSSVVYENNMYGFNFTLPESWKGYSIVDSEWQGTAQDEEKGETTAQTGPMVSIRDPKWTSKTPRQDIPIMIFTVEQWNSLQQGKFHIGAAPVNPTELGRNSRYVFALPARYNYAFPPGFEEVEAILQGSPLKPTQVYK